MKKRSGNCRRAIGLLALCFSPILGSDVASAASSTTSFQVTATVLATCSVSASDLAFGTVNPLGGNLDQTTTLSVACTTSTAYTVGLSAGSTSGATIAQRRMASGSNFINYNLYTDVGRSSIWGNSAVSPTWVSGTGAGLGAPQTLTVYGRVPSGQTDLAVGSYSEPAIAVTVTY
jgi:spore coat protein U-like protein